MAELVLAVYLDSQRILVAGVDLLASGQHQVPAGEVGGMSQPVTQGRLIVKDLDRQLREVK